MVAARSGSVKVSTPTACQSSGGGVEQSSATIEKGKWKKYNNIDAWSTEAVVVSFGHEAKCEWRCETQKKVKKKIEKTDSTSS